MFLNDIGKNPATRFKKINRYLKENHGIVLSSNLDDAGINAAFQQIHEEITQLKMQGETSHRSVEISKRLLVLEGLRSLKEEQAFLSPVYQSVLRNLVDYVVKEVKLEHTGQYDSFNELFNHAIRTAMNEYRSSHYRFPEHIVEKDLRSEANAILRASGHDTEVDEGAWDKVGGRSGALGGHVPDVKGKDALINKLGGNLGLSLEPQDGLPQRRMVRDPRTGEMRPDPFADKQRELRGTGVMHEDEFDDNNIAGKEEPLVRSSKTGRVQRNPFADQHRASRTHGVTHPAPSKPKLAPGKVINPRTGEEVTDPFTAHQQALRGAGVKMRESENLVKRLRHLLETEVSQAEVMMAAKGFAQELQEMVEKIGRLQNEDLPPVTDQMRQTYGTDSASAFQSQIYAALQGVMDALYTAKSQVDAAVDSMAATGQVGAQVDMDVDMSDELGSEQDMDDLGAGLDAASAEDEFGDVESEDPLGRAQKESITLQKKVLEMKRLVAKAKQIKESKKK